MKVTAAVSHPEVLFGGSRNGSVCLFLCVYFCVSS